MLQTVIVIAAFALQRHDSNLNMHNLSLSLLRWCRPAMPAATKEMKQIVQYAKHSAINRLLCQLDHSETNDACSSCRPFVASVVALAVYLYTL